MPPAITEIDASPLAPVAPIVLTPTASQRKAIEAPQQPVLVFAGPGAGKTFCLIERIRYLVNHFGVDPGRICVFTFTNKAAGEIAVRLCRDLDAGAERIKRGTIHAFCAEVLREFGDQAGLEPGFGIADEEYQRSVLRRLKVPAKAHKRVLESFSRFRFRGEPLGRNYQKYFDGYKKTIGDRNVVDFDTLLLKCAELLHVESVAASLRARWDAVLVDEFQDLNPVQYTIIRELARGHRNVFGVGDDEQSIYSWTGADPTIFRTFAKDFGIASDEHCCLEDNRRCPQEVLTLARRLMELNATIFEKRPPQHTDVRTTFPVVAASFKDENAELTWILADLRRDRDGSAGEIDWGDVACLYRKHLIGNMLEAALLNAGIPCRLAQGRALADDKVVAYVLAALKVIACPHDELHQENFYKTVLPHSIFDNARAKSEETGRGIVGELEWMARTLPSDNADARKIWRGHFALKNLDALGKSHLNLAPLVEEILSQRVGTYRTVLEDRQEDLTDPAGHEEVVRLCEQLESAARSDATVWMPRMGGIEIPLKGILREIGVRSIELGGLPPDDCEQITPDCFPTLGIALGVFKAAQLLRTKSITNTFRDFTAVDLETTDKDVETAEIVELAAVRVRHGRVVDQFYTRVRPRVPIMAGALATHGISESDVAASPYFEEVWQQFRDFCGQDVLVAHNGYTFDFPILRRMSAKLPRGRDFSTYDTLPLARTLHPTSRKLPHLARHYGINAGHSHSALDDAVTLARLFPALTETRIASARKTALVERLDHLAIALVLSDKDSLCEEAVKFLDFAPWRALRSRSDCLDFYRAERELAGDPSLPTVKDLIALLGGEQRMERVRSDRTADDLYPEVMARLRRLLDHCNQGPLAAQLSLFLERAVLSKQDGVETSKSRVNLLTLHSTKGLEFSRVYIVGAEDEEFVPLPPSGAPNRLEIEEARRLMYVGMTRTKQRLVLTRVKTRDGKSTRGHQFLDEMGLVPQPPS